MNTFSTSRLFTTYM